MPACCGSAACACCARKEAGPLHTTGELIGQPRRAMGLLSIAVLMTVACSAPDAVVFDFAANLDLAAVHAETRVINIGTPAGRRHLIRGWSYDERWAGDWTFAWGLWPESALEFYTFDPSTTVIRFRCSPSDAMAGAEPRVEVAVNGHDIAAVPLRRGFQNYEVRVPRQRLLVGRNELRFRYGHNGGVLPLSNDKLRPSLAVAWQRVRIGPESPPGSVETTDGSLEMPFNTRVDYFVSLAPGTTLRWGSVVSWGVAAGRASPTLRVEVVYEDDDTRPRVAGLTGPELAAPFAAALEGQARARVSFLAVPAGDTSEQGAGLRIASPRLTASAIGRGPNPSEAAAGQPRQPPAEAPRDRTNGPAGLPSDLRAALRASLPAGQAPNVIIYLVDTLRADHLSTYGYDRPTSPVLDDLATEGVVFDHAMAQSAWTRTSVASILTGLQPRAHNVLDREDALSSEAATLPGLLALQGYQTYAAITNGNVAPQFGFDNGFDSFVYLPEQLESQTVYQLSDQVNDAFFGWLAEHQAERPFFAYLHATDPHGPHAPREPYRSRFLRDSRLADLAEPDLIGAALERFPDLSIADAVAAMRDLYDAEIAYNDAQFGRLIDRLRDLGIYDSTMILFVSDHGEEFFDHGAFLHGRSLYSEIIFVPLVVKFPGSWSAGTRVDAAVQHVDIVPTVLDLVGASPLGASAGDSLVPVVSAAEEGTEHESFATRRLLAHVDLDGMRIDSLLTSDHHLIAFAPPDMSRAAQIFGWRTDPAEQVDLSDQALVSAGYLRLALRTMAAAQRGLFDAETAVIDEELAERLRALGYLQ